jgi:[ribosomal protein S5]-alanine N-acetyltransferase
MSSEKILSTPILSSHSVYLRVIEEKDVTNGKWHHWFNDYKLTCYNSHGVYPINIEDQRRYFTDAQSDDRAISLSVCSLSDHEVIGTVSLLNIDLLNRKAEIACTIGKNITPTAGLEAIGLMIQHGMNRVNLNKICGGAHDGLREWVKMLGCLGFTEEGILKQEALRNGEFSDVIKFGLLAEDYRNLHSVRDGHFLFATAGELYRQALSKLKLK